MIERDLRVHESVINSILATELTDLGDVVLYQLPVLLTHLVRNDGHLPPRLKILEADGLIVGKIHFRGVEHVKKDDVITREAEWFDRIQHTLRLLVKIRDDRQNTPPLEELRRFIEGWAQGTRPSRSHAIKGVQGHVEMLC